MKKKNRRKKSYTLAPKEIGQEIEASVSIEDFLPSPYELAQALQKSETIPITMKLKKTTVNKYKKFAQKKGVKYQKFVSTLLDSYAQRL